MDDLGIDDPRLDIRPRVYFIGADRRGAPVKIGRSEEEVPIGALRACQRGNPERLVILNAFEGWPGQSRSYFEGSMHDAFPHARMVGEWFDPYRDMRIEHLACADSRSAAEVIWHTVWNWVDLEYLPRRVDRRGPGWRHARVRRRRGGSDFALRDMYRAPSPLQLWRSQDAYNERCTALFGGKADLIPLYRRPPSPQPRPRSLRAQP